MKRKPLPPDTRLDWRDPEMPVLRDYKMGNGEHRTIVDHDYEHRYREHMMEAAPHPDYHNDPTYHLRKDRK